MQTSSIYICEKEKYMSTTLALTLSLNDIYKSVHEATTDVGLKQNMVGQLTKQGFQRTASTEFDEGFLKEYAQEVCNLLTYSFQRYTPYFRINEHYKIVDGEVQYDKLYTDISVSFYKIPSNALDISRVIEPLLNDVFKNYIIYKWFENVNNNESAAYKSQVETDIVGIRRLLNERVAPTRTAPKEVQYQKTNYE